MQSSFEEFDRLSTVATPVLLSFIYNTSTVIGILSCEKESATGGSIYIGLGRRYRLPGLARRRWLHCSAKIRLLPLLCLDLKSTWGRLHLLRLHLLCVFAVAADVFRYNGLQPRLVEKGYKDLKQGQPAQRIRFCLDEQS